MPYQKLPIGDLLLQQKLISAEQLATALAEQKSKGDKLGKTLIKLGYLTEDKFLSFLAEQLKISFIGLTNYPINIALAQQLPEKLAQRFNAILLAENNNHLLIGMADPQDIIAYDELTQFFKRPIELALVREAELPQTFNLIYRRTQEISNFAEALSVEMGSDDTGSSQAKRGHDTWMSTRQRECGGDPRRPSIECPEHSRPMRTASNSSCTSHCDRRFPQRSES